MRGRSTIALATILLSSAFAGCAAPLGGVGTFEQSLVRELKAEVNAIRELNAHFAAMHAEFTATIGGDAVGVKTTTLQTAAGNINDAWAIRLAAGGGPLSMLVYMFVVRPLRNRRKCRREKRLGETAGENRARQTG